MFSEVSYTESTLFEGNFSNRLPLECSVGRPPHLGTHRKKERVLQCGPDVRSEVLSKEN